eukprot:TRINITY_DN47002_c0_g1_i1.p1 TRINITY_DN47002_c0_g1~~TRINITY_DN47002_c0_g1_i1.p1  ORF type:complete len:395 (-),score=35.02 TRINITY_DN47002_c0_g1_i1:136-1269(-)
MATSPERVNFKPAQKSRVSTGVRLSTGSSNAQSDDLSDTDYGLSEQQVRSFNEPEPDPGKPLHRRLTCGGDAPPARDSEYGLAPEQLGHLSGSDGDDRPRSASGGKRSPRRRGRRRRSEKAEAQQSSLSRQAIPEDEGRSSRSGSQTPPAVKDPLTSALTAKESGVTCDRDSQQVVADRNEVSPDVPAKAPLMKALSSDNAARLPARDSDFGLSDRQLRSLAESSREPVLKKALSSTAPIASGGLHTSDSDFGLSDRQLERFNQVDETRRQNSTPETDRGTHGGASVQPVYNGQAVGAVAVDNIHAFGKVLPRANEVPETCASTLRHPLTESLSDIGNFDRSSSEVLLESRERCHCCNRLREFVMALLQPAYRRRDP